MRRHAFYTPLTSLLFHCEQQRKTASPAFTPSLLLQPISIRTIRLRFAKKQAVAFNGIVITTI